MTAVARWVEAIAKSSAAIGQRVRIDAHSVFDRTGDLPLGAPGIWSPNRCCRLIRAADDWLAINLPRDDDLDLVPAWLGYEIGGDPWRALEAAAPGRTAEDLLAGARLLGLAVSIVGETPRLAPAVKVHTLGAGAARCGRAPHVVDLSSLWAGPLCAGVLAEAGAVVTRFESRRRPDTTRITAPAFYARLNGRKAHVTLDFGAFEDRQRLADAIAGADVVVTSARPRAFAALGITPETMMARKPGLIWVAITGHGWMGAECDRIAFGDDAAAAGGMLRFTERGDPRFKGDALADPMSGLAAAAAALEALGCRGGVLIDVALARVAAAANHTDTSATGQT